MKLTKKNVKEVISNITDGKIADINIYANSTMAGVVVITEHHNIEYWTVVYDDVENALEVYFDILDTTTNFSKKPIMRKEV